MNVEEILMARRSPEACAAEVWAKKREEEKRRKSEEVANRIAALMEEVKDEVDEIVSKLREVRAQEKAIKNQLDAIGKPYIEAEAGLDKAIPDISSILPLLKVRDLDPADFGFSGE